MWRPDRRWVSSILTHLRHTLKEGRVGLDLSLLETFTLVADLGSFSGAARRLGLTQPAVSFQVKALEKELGASLIDRSGGKVLLTPAGRTAYSHARKMLAGRDELIADIPRTTGEVSGVLRIGASTVPGEWMLPQAFAVFKERYPRVRVCMEISESERVIRMVRDERVELGFVGMEPDAGLEARKFGHDNLVAVVPPAHPLAGTGEVSLEALAGEPWVVRSDSSGTRKRAFEALRAAGIEEDDLEVAAELGSTRAVLSAVAAGMGVTLASDRAAGPAGECGQVAVAGIAGADLRREFYAVRSPDRPLSRAAEEFLKAACGG